VIYRAEADPSRAVDALVARGFRIEDLSRLDARQCRHERLAIRKERKRRKEQQQGLSRVALSVDWSDSEFPSSRPSDTKAAFFKIKSTSVALGGS
jgi:hypothetical protein